MSAGCANCYAERLSLRYGWSKKPWAAANAAENVVLHPERLRKPYSFKQPSRVFVNSMSDLFHPLVPDEFIQQVFDVMDALPQHTFQVLTKRPERMNQWFNWPHNVWAGTSVEDHRVVDRIDHLRQTDASIRFLSCEPLIGSLGPIDLTNIDWVIVGGESGPGFRPMDLDWAREIRDQCIAAGVPYFFKQDSGFRSGMNPTLDGETWQQYPETTPAGQMAFELTR